MTAGSAPGRPGWPWALLFVACCHLLTTSGTWAILDHAEILYTARHVLHHGTFNLTAPGVPRLKFITNVVSRPGQPVRSRFLPLPTLTLIPLLAADEALGWGDEREFGHLVHLQGHIFVMAGLALLGLALRGTGASDAGAAMGVLLAGLAWPVWLVSRRVGPEPVIIALLGAYVFAESRARPASRVALKGTVCLLLPWTHVTGALLAGALVVAEGIRALAGGRGRWGEAAGIAALAAAGGASMVYFWNHLFQGDWIAGGYGLYQPEQAFGARNALAGLLDHVVAFAAQSPVLLVLAVAGWRVARGQEPVAAFARLALCLTGVLLLIFATFYSPDPTRRLAVACPLWAAVAGSSWDRLRLAPPVPQALVAAAGLVSFAWFEHLDGGWRVAAGGWNLPQYVLWADLVRAGRPWAAALPVLGLLLVGLLAAARVWTLLGPRPAGVGFARAAAAL